MSFFKDKILRVPTLSQTIKDSNAETSLSKRCLVTLKNVLTGQTGQTGTHALHHAVSQEHRLEQDVVNKARLV